MKEHQIHDAIGEISEELIDPVAKLRQKKRYPVIKWAAVAACLCLVLSLPLGLGSKNGLKMESTTAVGTPEMEMEQLYDGLLDNKTAASSNMTANAAVFRAKVLEVQEKNVLVEPLEGEKELLSSDKIYVSLGKLAQIPEIRVGDILMIHYDGMIQETYPAQINGTYAIDIVK